MKVVVIGGTGLIGSKVVTMLRAQGHETVAASPNSGVDTVRLAPVLVQPIATDDVASAVAGVAVGAPVNGTVEVAGPEQFRFDAFIEKGLRARNDPRKVVATRHAPYFRVEVGERTLVPGDGARLARTRFEDWLREPAHL